VSGVTRDGEGDVAAAAAAAAAATRAYRCALNLASLIRVADAPRRTVACIIVLYFLIQLCRERDADADR